MKHINQKITVLKIGGKVLDNEEELHHILSAFATIKSQKVLVHGGGVNVDKVLQKLGIQKKYIDGRRVTDSETLDVVSMVLSGLTNTQLVAKLQSLNVNALGLTGADLNLIKCQKRPINQNFNGYDFGFVGDIKTVNIEALLLLLEQGITPVICPITHDGQGQRLNTNADTIAQSVASGLSQYCNVPVELLYCFKLSGVYEDISQAETKIHHLSLIEYQDHCVSGVIHSGMLPKLENCFSALSAGVGPVVISDVKNLTQYIETGKADVTEIVTFSNECEAILK